MHSEVRILQAALRGRRPPQCRRILSPRRVRAVSSIHIIEIPDCNAGLDISPLLLTQVHLSADYQWLKTPARAGTHPSRHQATMPSAYFGYLWRSFVLMMTNLWRYITTSDHNETRHSFPPSACLDTKGRWANSTSLPCFFALAQLVRVADARIVDFHAPSALKSPLLVLAVVSTLLLACCAVVNLRPPHLSGSAKRASLHSDPFRDAELLDIVLVASVDGKFHALNRTTGHLLWSMSSLSSSSTSASQQAPLVRTRHLDYDSDNDAYPETYIIEPQSGVIYVIASPSSPLQRFPFTTFELVDMSPFSFAGGDDHRVFVGRKETSSFALELETGNIKATIDSECPWDPFEDLREGDDEIDLDELEGSKPPISKPTEVFIGRTDYYITIHTRPSSKHRIPVQNLPFSTYGPNNQDNILQEAYRHPKDDVYIQSLPNGEIMSFKARGESSAPEDPLLWAFKFNNTIVAIFDVLRNPTQHPPNTFLIFTPHILAWSRRPAVFFAMSPDRFPLVVFGGGRNKAKAIDTPTDEPPLELLGEIDVITTERKRREKAMKERKYGSEDDGCMDRSSLYSDRRCLVGIRPLEGGDGDGPEMRLKRLINSVPSIPPQLDPLGNTNMRLVV
ncbi:hypothetical protein MSAN_00921500 [Mycena sanguinolenta]|uniref:Uncharacterized protein n=1 Tax=Mycena sanguinolenta TaxID=230812 RepID=A0A8H6YYJ7_9AGAR|nr:hypothetical protein MSAN_00921500 [Mycena sanguinolenta]